MAAQARIVAGTSGCFSLCCTIECNPSTCKHWQVRYSHQAGRFSRSRKYPGDAMSRPAAHPIVETAIQLLMELPHAPALAILDRAMKAHQRGNPNFKSWDVLSRRTPHPCYADELDPPSPFAELIRRAFAPQMDPRELVLISLMNKTDSPELNQRIAKLNARWQAVLGKFAERYQLWTCASTLPEERHAVAATSRQHADDMA
jgi:hypothetical protein